MLPTPRAVLFDMTGTLHPQAHVATAAIAATGMLLERHPEVAPDTIGPLLERELRTQFREHMAQGFYLLRDLLAAGHRIAWREAGVELADDELAVMLDRFESTFVSAVQPYPSAFSVLDAVRGAGIATAIVSVNDEQLLQDAVDACGFRHLFDLVLSSEAARSCKPEPGMFLQALAALGVPAADAVFVGDMPDLDIAGAKRVGMRTVLTTEDSSFLPHFADDVDCVPDVTISSLAELPGVLGLT